MLSWAIGKTLRPADEGVHLEVLVNYLCSPLGAEGGGGREREREISRRTPACNGSNSRKSPHESLPPVFLQ